MQPGTAFEIRFAVAGPEQDKALGGQVEARCQMPAQMQLGGEEASGQVFAGKAQRARTLCRFQPFEYGLQQRLLKRIEAMQ